MSIGACREQRLSANPYRKLFRDTHGTRFQHREIDGCARAECLSQWGQHRITLTIYDLLKKPTVRSMRPVLRHSVDLVEPWCFNLGPVPAGTLRGDKSSLTVWFRALFRFKRHLQCEAGYNKSKHTIRQGQLARKCIDSIYSIRVGGLSTSSPFLFPLFLCSCSWTSPFSGLSSPSSLQPHCPCPSATSSLQHALSCRQVASCLCCSTSSSHP